MRGKVDPQGHLFTYFSPESRVPAVHPLRAIKAYADRVLASMNGEFDRIYAETGRPSIPPERLLKASLLIALYSGPDVLRDARLQHVVSLVSGHEPGGTGAGSVQL